MAVFMCQWPNGDVSFGEATSKSDAERFFDDQGDTTDAKITKVKRFGLHLMTSANAAEQDVHVKFGRDTRHCVNRQFVFEQFDLDFEDFLTDSGIKLGEVDDES